MQIVSTNIAKPKNIIWNNREFTTGIYKTPIHQPIFLGKQGVQNDEVSDRNVHGGEFKACYLFSSDHYSYWKNLYPNLDWDFGMFGENLTISSFNERHINIGDIYEIGPALVQVTQPREPCFKFAYKFGSENVLKQFIDYGYSGTYIRILEEGFVKTDDPLKLIEKAKNSISVWQFFNLLYSKEKNQEHIKLIQDNNALPKRKRDKLKAFLK